MIGPRALRTDVLRGHPVSNARLAPPRPMARRRIRNRFKQALTGNHSKRYRAHRTGQEKGKLGLLVHRASHVSLGRRVNPVFSVLRESKVLPMQKARRSSRTIARRA